jgi:hypothetical protein
MVADPNIHMTMLCNLEVLHTSVSCLVDSITGLDATASHLHQPFDSWLPIQSPLSHPAGSSEPALCARDPATKSTHSDLALIFPASTE